jgi:hypothetical protein
MEIEGELMKAKLRLAPSVATERHPRSKDRSADAVPKRQIGCDGTENASARCGVASFVLLPRRNNRHRFVSIFLPRLPYRVDT